MIRIRLYNRALFKNYIFNSTFSFLSTFTFLLKILVVAKIAIVIVVIDVQSAIGPIDF